MLASRSVLPIFLFLSLLFSFISLGCENIFEDMADDSTEEARLEEARMALDKGDYTTAVNIFLDLCGLSAADPTSGTPTCDNATISLLASAYMGRAGLDLIKIIDTAAQTGSTGPNGTFVEFSQLLLAGNETDMHNALVILNNIPGKTPDQNLQMAVAAAADTLMIIMGVPGVNIDPATGLPTTVPVSANFDSAAQTITNNKNISLISAGIDGSGIVNADLTNDIKTIQSNISGDVDVTSTELRTYLCSFTPPPTGCP